MMCADATDTLARDRLFSAKQRPRDKALLHLVSGPEQLDAIAHVTAGAAALARQHWPGRLALLLPARSGVTSVGEDAVRGEVLVTQPDGLLGQLAADAPCPLVGAVVSRSVGAPAGPTPPARCIDDVLAFDRAASGVLAAVVDGGAFPPALHLTIIRVDAGGPCLVRSGALAWDETDTRSGRVRAKPGR